MKKWYWLGILLSAQAAWAGDVQVQFDGCVAGQTVRVALYAAPAEGFPKRGALKELELPATASTAHATFSDLPAGRYAIAAYLDSNGNHKLDRHWFGSPSEPYGFSNNARNTFSAPGFEQAAFELSSAPVLQTIHLH